MGLVITKNEIMLNKKNTLKKGQSNFNFLFAKNYYLRFSSAYLITAILSFFICINPSLAGDPFRTEDQRNIGNKTEAAFKALFEDGNYKKTKTYLVEASESEKNDPLVHAIRASIAYTEQDWEEMQTYALKTVKVADKISSDDPLRGNLYLAVGNFLEGTYIFQKEGPVPAITKLQQVFTYFDKAEKIDNDDPELNLIKGYLNLFLAVKLPFSSAEEAIARLENYAAPKYLVNRGIAIAYRDLKKYDEALKYVELAIKGTPFNPEIYYLKGQILRKKGRDEENIEVLTEALKYFDIALEKQEQLPVEAVKKPLNRERRKTQEKIDEIIASKNNPTP